MPHYVNGKEIPVVGNDKENLEALNNPKQEAPKAEKILPKKSATKNKEKK
jgi:hypothetical protein